MRGTCALLFALAFAAGCAPPPPTGEVVAPTVASPTAERPADSITLIDRAVSAGRLDYSTGVLYKVYVMFEPESVPPEYGSDVPSKCGTPLVQEVQRNWNMLTAEHRSEISQYIQPVTEVDRTDTQLDDVSPDRLEGEREKLD
jgi:hypothetical protein